MPSTKSMTGHYPSVEFPNRFQRESLNLIDSLFDMSSLAFYLVGPDMRHRGVVLHKLDADVERSYASDFRDMDPLNPAKFCNTEDRVVCIDEQIGEAELLQSQYYRDFMVPNDHRHVADMLFRSAGKIIAVVTMLRAASKGPFTQQELAHLRKLQPFLEYALNCVYLPKRVEQRRDAQARFSLTDREVDVLELVVAGASNKEVARELGLSLATVKTHIQHLFQKAEVSSRTALSARLQSDVFGSGGPHPFGG